MDVGITAGSNCVLSSSHPVSRSSSDTPPSTDVCMSDFREWSHVACGLCASFVGIAPLKFIPVTALQSFLLKILCRALSNGSVVKSMECSSRGPRLNPHPRESSQPPIIPFLGSPMPFSGLWGHCTLIVQDIYTSKIPIDKHTNK